MNIFEYHHFEWENYENSVEMALFNSYLSFNYQRVPWPSMAPMSTDPRQRRLLTKRGFWLGRTVTRWCQATVARGELVKEPVLMSHKSQK